MQHIIEEKSWDESVATIVKNLTKIILSYIVLQDYVA